MELIASLIGLAFNLYMLWYMVRLLRHRIGVWSPNNIASGYESFAASYAGIFKWLGPVVILNFALISLGALVMVIRYAIESI